MECFSTNGQMTGLKFGRYIIGCPWLPLFTLKNYLWIGDHRTLILGYICGVFTAFGLNERFGDLMDVIILYISLPLAMVDNWGFDYDSFVGALPAVGR